MTSFDLIHHVPSSHTIKPKKSIERTELEQLYQNIRNIREGKKSAFSIEENFEILKKNHPNDWLLCIESVELLQDQKDEKIVAEVMQHLVLLKQRRPEIIHLIDAGLDLIFKGK